ncbi:hypothetical protein ACIQXV_26660 [Neobacillus sp. NPDC097160]|uniref:hypothetical protein n=1 Tax=Neobacillus sp. NPDC097160 TaxID=3364298 RepID=UPI0037FAC0B3
MVTATDSFGNVSETAALVVKDVTAPAAPQVNEVTNQSTAISGEAEVGSTWYYCNSSGAMQTGWAQISGKWYYFNQSGALK